MKGNSTSAGRLCVWSQTNPNDDPDKFKDFQSYREALQLQCRAGNPGVLQWTPDRKHIKYGLLPELCKLQHGLEDSGC